MRAEGDFPGMVQVHHQAHQITAPEEFLHQRHHHHGTEEAQDQRRQPAPGIRGKDDAGIKAFRAHVNSQQVPVPWPGGVAKPCIRTARQTVRRHRRGQPAQDAQHAEEDSPCGGFPFPVPVNGFSPPQDQDKADDGLHRVQPLLRRPSPPGGGGVVPFQERPAKLPQQGKAHEHRKRRYVRPCFQGLRDGVHGRGGVRKEFSRNAPCGCRLP